MNNFFSETSKEKIQQTLAQAEKRTSGEIVPLVVEESSSYAWIPFSYAFVVLLFNTLVIFFLSTKNPWVLEPKSLLVLQGLSFLAGYSLGQIPFLKRLLVRKFVAKAKVERSAHAQFMAHGLTETKDRTGVLIYISLLEHSVRILADKGIHERLPQEYWQSSANTLAQSIRAGRGVEGLCNCILSIGEKLQSEFPVQLDDTNELKNELHTEKKF